MAFTKGQPSANPGGKPKTKEITECLRLLLSRYTYVETTRTKKGEEKKPEDKIRLLRRNAGQKTTAREEVAMAIINDAIRGIGNNRELLLDRIEGKVSQPIRGDDDPEAPPIRTQDETLKELARSTAFLLTAFAPPVPGSQEKKK